jgi:hypothetical protein
MSARHTFTGTFVTTAGKVNIGVELLPSLEPLRDTILS